MTSFVTAGYTSAGQRVVLWRLGDYTYEIQGAMKALENNSKESIFLLDVSYEKALKKFKEYIKQLLTNPVQYGTIRYSQRTETTGTHDGLGEIPLKVSAIGNYDEKEFV